MKVVVDTNILFSFFWKESFTRRLLESSRFVLISPKIALEELEKYKIDIKKKSGISDKEFSDCIEELRSKIKFIDEKDYLSYVQEAEKFSPDNGDVEFFALCLKENCILWSNDSLLKEQDKIKVLNTEEIVNLIFG